MVKKISSYHADSPARPFKASLPALLTLTGIFFLNFVSRIIPAPLSPVIEQDLNISHTGSGLLFLLISIGFFIGMLGVGFITRRNSHRNLILFSTATMGIALIATSLADSLLQLRITLFCVGMSTGIYLPSALPTLTSFIRPTDWGKAMAVHELAPSLAFVLAPILAETLIDRWSWRAVFLLFGIAALLLTCAFAAFGRGGRFSGAPLDISSAGHLIKTPSFWFLLLMFILGISSTLGVYSMLPLFLIEDQGFDRNLANQIMALSRATTIGTVLIGGWVTDRFGLRKTMGGVLILSGSTTALLGISSGGMLILFFFLQPMLAVCFFPAGYTALSKLTRPETRNIAVSLTLPLAFLMGGGAVPTFLGRMGDMKLFSLGYLLLGCSIALGGVACLFLFPEKGDTKTEEQVLTAS